jgi:transketolase
MSTGDFGDLDRLCVDTIRTLSMDAVQRANSGHPGAPMGMAPVAFVLFDRFLRHCPTHPDWPGRDRFVLSMGHASMLLYSLLHLTGYDLSLDELKSFRQLHSKCAGHPEYGLAPGVETTTGPLGQGAGNSVGMAIAGKWRAAHYDRPGYEMFNFRVFAMCSDGDMMEGVASEAASLAGHLRLNNLVWLYDNNRITIDGSTDLSFSEDVAKRFEAYGWHTDLVTDANDLASIEAAVGRAVAVDDRPSMIVVNSHIGYGSPKKQDSAAAHGSPLGPDEVRATKQVYGWDADAEFLVPKEVATHMRGAVQRGEAWRSAWENQFESYSAKHPQQAKHIRQMESRALPDGWDAELPQYKADGKGLATRQSSGEALSKIAEHVPWLIGGSADLAGSNNTTVGDGSSLSAATFDGRNMHFGIREHGMGAIANGMSLCRLRPYVATFLVFSDYMRASIRLASIMHQPVIYLFTHDSIGLGEDGPTHQPIEHLAALRAIPHLDVIRPADAAETVQAWQYALGVTDHPVALALTRQALPNLDRARMAGAEGLLRGGYVLLDCEGTSDIILIATGSEVQLCVSAAAELAAGGRKVRVVSMPCWEQFERQDDGYRASVLQPEVRARVAVEAASPMGWDRYVGPAGVVVGRNEFGVSAPAKDAFAYCGFTVQGVLDAAAESMRRAERTGH